jgi:endonuclease-3 related protein
MPRASETLMTMYQAMLDRFGHQKWWGGDTALEMCVGAILTQNTNWANVKKALANLKSAGAMSVGAIRALPLPELAELIRPAGYFNVKAKRLANFIARVYEFSGEDLARFLDRSISALREDLLSINGVGRETADSMILYAAHKPTFVVDTYTFRILLRHQLIDADYDYEMIKEFLESNLAEDVELFNDFHAQFVAVGKNFCKPTAKCEGCPLEHLPHDRFLGSAREE